MKFMICICFVIICSNLINQTEETGQRSADLEIKKLEYLKLKLQKIADKLIFEIQFITNLERALLESIIDALRRLAGIDNKSNQLNNLTEDETLKLIEDCEELIRKYEWIQKDKQNEQKY